MPYKKWIGIGLLGTASSVMADAFNWTVDTTQSALTTKITATIGAATLTDSETNRVAGFVGGTLELPSYTFDSIHLTAADLSYTTNPTFSLTAFLLGGVNIVGNGLGFAIPGPNGLGFASPTSASVDLAGSFSQVGNGAEGRGTLTYTGVGILGASIGTGTINLLDQSPIPMDWNGTITQAGNQLLLSLPVHVDQTTVQNGIPVRVEINGAVLAKATTAANGWKADVDGTWGTQGNWVGNTAIPGAAGQTTFDTAVFGDFGVNAQRTITLAVPVSPRRVMVDAGPTGQYRFVGTQSITLTPGAAGAASIRVSSGEARFESPVILSSDATFHADLAAKISASQINSPTTATLHKTGAGTLRIEQADVGIIHAAAGVLELSGTTNAARAQSLQIDPTGKLAVRDALVVENQAGSVAAITTFLRTSFAAGASGGILPSSLGRLGVGTRASTGLPAFGGFSLTDSSILVRLTLSGDTNLDRTVNFDDLLQLAQHYGTPGFWYDGDFNYDGAVNFDDLLELAQRYGTSLSVAEKAQLPASFATDFALAQSMAPEPTIATGILCLASRRRRRDAN